MAWLSLSSGLENVQTTTCFLALSSFSPQRLGTSDSPMRFLPCMPTRQLPIHSGFGARTTAREAIANRRLDGLTAVVTGGYAGIGLETTRALSEAGATVLVPARTPDK